jgi:WD40 repeat protein
MKVSFLAKFTGHTGAVYCLKESMNPGHVYSGSADGMIALWDVKLGIAMPFSIKVGNPVFAIELHSKKQLLFVGQAEGSIHIVDLGNRKEIRNLKYSNKGIFKIRFLERLNMLLALGGEGNLAVIDGDDFGLKLDLKLSDDKLRCLEISESETHLFIGSSDGYIRVLDTSYFNEWTKVPAHEGGIYTMAWLSDTLMITGGRDGHLRLWNVNGIQLNQIESIPAHNYAIYDVVVSPDRSYFATASRDKMVKVWNISDLKNPIRLSRTGLNGHSHSVNSLLWIESLNQIISAGDDRQIISWQIS